MWEILGRTETILANPNNTGSSGVTDPRVGTTIGVGLCDARSLTALAMGRYTKVFQMTAVGIVQATSRDVQMFASRGGGIALIDGARVVVITNRIVRATVLQGFMHTTTGLTTT